jgi:hypothetical protein
VDRFFPYALDLRYATVFLSLGVNPRRDGVALSDDGRFTATYGRFRVETPLSNIAGAHITGGYRWWSAVGVRLSLVDDGLTFGTNADSGVCVHFQRRIPAVLGLRDHSALTVTVADVGQLHQQLAHACGDFIQRLGNERHLFVE